ncbi:MAG TPA: hypothetical protein VIH57_25275 [Bacteroidales bacterium]
MANKKKKVSCNFAKQNEAHHRNLFIQKLIEVAKAVSVNGAYKLLDPHLLNLIYFCRFHSTHFISGDDGINWNSQIAEIKEHLMDQLKNNYFRFDLTGKEISQYDLYGPGLSLWANLYNLVKTKNPLYAQIGEAFKDFIETDNIGEQILKAIYSVTNFHALELSSLDKRIVSIKVEVMSRKDGNPYLHTQAKITSYKPEIIEVTIDGNTRPAFRLGFSYNGSPLNWMDCSAHALGLNYLPEDAKIPVYLQHHALNRLEERLDCFCNATRLFGLMNSVYKAKCIRYNGKLLLEYYYEDDKLGYLMIELVKGVAVVRTFLLLTHNCTPESEMLNKIIGLEKQDISFLNLDKLSTFTHSDICENTMLCDLFTRAGCKSLIDDGNKFLYKDKLIKNASAIESYFSKYQEYFKALELPEPEPESVG